MTNPTRYLLRMVLVLVVVALVAALLFGELRHAFAVNPVLNALILAVLVLGAGWCIRQVLLLKHEVDWLSAFRSPRPGTPATSIHPYKTPRPPFYPFLNLRDPLSCLSPSRPLKAACKLPRAAK